MTSILPRLIPLAILALIALSLPADAAADASPEGWPAGTWLIGLAILAGVSWFCGRACWVGERYMRAPAPDAMDCTHGDWPDDPKRIKPAE